MQSAQCHQAAGSLRGFDLNTLLFSVCHKTLILKNIHERVSHRFRTVGWNTRGITNGWPRLRRALAMSGNGFSSGNGTLCNSGSVSPLPYFTRNLTCLSRIQSGLVAFRLLQNTLGNPSTSLLCIDTAKVNALRRLAYDGDAPKISAGKILNSNPSQLYAMAQKTIIAVD
jgi:hypothetical protein